MLEYHWLFALLLRSARYFTGVEGKYLAPTYLAAIFPEIIHNNYFKFVFWLLLIGFVL